MDYNPAEIPASVGLKINLWMAVRAVDQGDLRVDDEVCRLVSLFKYPLDETDHFVTEIFYLFP